MKVCDDMMYPHLFAPIKINGMVARNRIIASPIGDIYEEKALGGAGIVIAGAAIVDPGRSSCMSADEPFLFSKYRIAEAQEKIRKCHQSGAKASLELFHAGQYARVKDYAVGPMAFTREDGTQVKALTPDMMEEIAEKYAYTASQAKDLGFDMIFMHFGHGWLAPQFLSPLFNKRTDEYGGSFENRAKFPQKILEHVRRAVGSDFPIDMRISAIEWVDGSIEFQDTLAFIKLVEPLIDTVQISAGLDMNREGNVHMATTNFAERMPNAKYAKIVKENVKIPVSVVGAVLSPDEAEDLIVSGTVDMVAFGRAFVADPGWPNKALYGNEDDIVPCIRCLQCYHISTDRRNVGCSVNPRYCNESFISKNLTPAVRKKSVAIIGAGPAGMMAAITASKRGHDVVLYEKNSYLGGALHFVAMESYKDEIKVYLGYLCKQLEKSNVTVKLNTQISPEDIKKSAPDVLFLAMGAKACTPDIPGLEKSHVLNFYQAIENAEEVGRNVFIIGGGTIGIELAVELAEQQDRNVTVVEIKNEIAAQGNILYKIALRQKMEKLINLTCMTETSCEEISDTHVRVKTKSGEIIDAPADSVIVAVGVAADQEMTEQFFGIVPETFQIGDCLRPRKIMEAVFDGYSIASNI